MKFAPTSLQSGQPQPNAMFNRKKVSYLEQKIGFLESARDRDNARIFELQHRLEMLAAAQGVKFAELSGLVLVPLKEK